MKRKLSRTERAVVENGVRWCTIILTELCGKYAEYLPEIKAESLRHALANLYAVMDRDVGIEVEDD